MTRNPNKRRSVVDGELWLIIQISSRTANAVGKPIGSGTSNQVERCRVRATDCSTIQGFVSRLTVVLGTYVLNAVVNSQKSSAPRMMSAIDQSQSCVVSATILHPSGYLSTKKVAELLNKDLT